MNRQSIFKNTIYAFLLQFTNLIFPIITAPYISRVIGAQGLGKVNFSASVVSWFALFATIGTGTYGVKEVAKLREDKDALICFFSELMILKIITTIFVITIYLPCVFLVDKFSREYVLFLIQGVTLILNIFSIDWLFQGVEDYKYITNRSIFLRSISLVALFLMVKSKDDYIIYAGILVFALSFSNILNFIYSKKYVHFARKGLAIKRHIKPLSVFFLSSMVISVYALLDQVLLGFIKGDNDVALFVRTKMFMGCGMSVALTFSNVVMPRLNNYFINDRYRYKELLRISADIVLLVSLPIMTGTVALANNVMFLFGGREFLPASVALIIVAPLVTIVPIGTWNYQQRMLPLKCEKLGLYGQIAIAIVSIVSNLILTPVFGFIGAAISYLLGETTGAIIGFIYMYKKDVFSIFRLSQTKYLIAAGGMAGWIMLIQTQMSVSWLSLFICITSGAIAYFAQLLVLNDKLVRMLLDYFKQKVWIKV